MFNGFRANVVINSELQKKILFKKLLGGSKSCQCVIRLLTSAMAARLLSRRVAGRAALSGLLFPVQYDRITCSVI